MYEKDNNKECQYLMNDFKSTKVSVAQQTTETTNSNWT